MPCMSSFLCHSFLVWQHLFPSCPAQSAVSFFFPFLFHRSDFISSFISSLSYYTLHYPFLICYCYSLLRQPFGLPEEINHCTDFFPTPLLCSAVPYLMMFSIILSLNLYNFHMLFITLSEYLHLVNQT